jgi:hypothetical protein
VLDDLHARRPIDKTAAMVLAKGESFVSKKKIVAVHRDAPIKTKPTPYNSEDLTGAQFGSFTVCGLSVNHKGKWVVRCRCGRWSLRRAAAIKNPANEGDCCEECRQLVYLRRSEYFRRTGRDMA